LIEPSRVLSPACTLVLLGATALGCAAGSSDTGDASPGAAEAGADTSTPLRDGGPDGDASRHDAGDAANDSDGPTGLDGAATDASPPAPVMGLSWPAGQAFPTFAPPATTLDVVNETGLSADTCTLVVTLEGLVNRTQPRIWVTDGSSQQALWLAQTDAGSNTVTDPLSLVTKYASEIAGIVIYDDTVADTLNLATTIAGVKGGIVASPALSTTLTAAPYNLAVLDDLRTNAFTSTLDVYQYELDNYASLTTHRLITGLELTIPDHLRDYTVATKAMMVWLDPTNAAQEALLEQFLALLEPNSPYLGWWTSEGPGVQTAATYGVPVFAADWSMNLTVLGGTPRGSTPPPVPPPPPLENKMYVAIFMSDGDNLQEDEGLVPLKWADSNRGSVPISWTIDPALVDVAPVILRYFQSTATVDDLLVSGPSGLGYTYPEAWTGTAFDAYTQLSGSYLDTAGLRVITLWNNGVDLSAASAQSYATNVPGLLGMTIQNDGVARQFVNGTLPVDVMEVSYAPTEQTLESGLDSAVAAYDGSRPFFAAIQGDMNYSTITPTNFLDVRNHYANDSNVVFVRADHYFELMSRANAPPQHELFTGDVNDDGKTDAFFYYGGNGDVWVGLSDGTNLTWSNAGNISGFGNLLDGSHQLFTGDFNGDGKTDLAFYYNGDGSVWLGTSTGTAFTWASLGTTALGNWLDGKHRVHVGDYDGNGKADFSVYDSTTGTISFGLSSGASLAWDSASSVGGFGDLLDGAHGLFDGDFNGDGKQDLVFFYNGDGSVWLGASSGTALTWSQMGNVSGFGNLIDYAHDLFAGDFNADGKTDLGFYYAGDGSVWLGLSNGTALAWAQASSTTGMGNLIDLNHRLYTADVNGDGKLDVVSYDAATGDWNLGVSNGTTLAWSAGGSTSSHGDLVDFAHLLWLGDFDGTGKAAPLFYSASDGNFWMADSSGTTLSWHLAGNTSGFGNLTE
jgi:GxGYxY sequence motif in domain of unknown function N-terminal/GxGYxYP putative glycoside hydrolase C-terminal domain/FG-GAP-like repeat